MRGVETLTWPFVAFTAIVRCARQPTLTGIDIVAGQDLFARVRGPPVAWVDQQVLDRGSVSTRALGILQCRGTCRHFIRLPVSAIFAQAASLADRLQNLIRL